MTDKQINKLRKIMMPLKKKYDPQIEWQKKVIREELKEMKK
jgi:hypothetical protein